MTWTQDPIYVSGMLCIFVLMSVWLAKFRGWKALGTPILVILIAAIASNFGIIPTATSGNPVYTGVFMYLAPMGIFIALLEVDLKSLKKAGGPILFMFGIGGLGTIIGVLVAWFLVQPAAEIGSMANAVAGMYTGTYIGGSLNFNAIALSYQVNENADLYAATTVVDNLIGMPWIIATLILPKYLQRFFPRKKLMSADNELQKIKKHEAISMSGMATILGLAFLSLAFSKFVFLAFPQIPEIITLTTLALILAQLPFAKKLSGTHTIGFFLILLFLATIGTLCDLGTLSGIGELAATLFLFVTIIVLIHGLVIFGVGALFKVDWDVIAVASQANVGGNTTALAAAESLDRPDLLIPGVLVGSLGNALGTYAGFFIAGMLG
ncbi:putative membrane protein [Algoriphagus ratkowskyi]|uniref:DUF819 family protein n=1 Tax=Algoriphagus ratkowskyi TaxID=57028 RepID=A0A2W7RE91_9BACT|nr:DUF819 family protein [Algoriphagus ratkowskyi]PZX59223.1 putative membrane protein [Algoriphagus ratkowskyi]TXD77494.1 DUF819 family protein [Algoriphagus ratkowskyi]